MTAGTEAAPHVRWSPVTAAGLRRRPARLEPTVIGVKPGGCLHHVGDVLGEVVAESLIIVALTPFLIVGYVLFGRPTDIGEDVAELMAAGIILVVALPVGALAYVWFVLPVRRGTYLSTAGLDIRDRTLGRRTTVPWEEVAGFVLRRRDRHKVVVVRLRSGRSMALPQMARDADGRPLRRGRAELVARSLGGLVDQLDVLVARAVVVAEVVARAPRARAVRIADLPDDGPTACLVPLAADETAEAVTEQLTARLVAGEAVDAATASWATWTGAARVHGASVAVGPLDRFAARVPRDELDLLLKVLGGRAAPQRCLVVRITPISAA